jgi:tetratricopeptide (TPR) repeat protein
MATERYDLALNRFRQAREIDPTFPETNLNIGAAYIRLGQLDSAQYYLYEEKRYHPGRDKADINLASIHLLSGNTDAAIDRVGASLKSRPYDPLANMILLRALHEDTTVTTAALIDSVNAARLRTRDDIYVLNDVAIRLTAGGELEAARMLFNRATVSTPPPIEIDDYVFERNFRNSRDNLNREWATANYQLGYICGLKGKFEQSVDYSRKAIELDSNLVEAYVNLINGYILTGRTEQARETLRTAVARFPDDNYVRQLQLRMEH